MEFSSHDKPSFCQAETPSLKLIYHPPLYAFSGSPAFSHEASHVPNADGRASYLFPLPSPSNHNTFCWRYRSLTACGSSVSSDLDSSGSAGCPSKSLTSVACRKGARASRRAPKAQLLTTSPSCPSLTGWGTCESSELLLALSLQGNFHEEHLHAVGSLWGSGEELERTSGISWAHISFKSICLSESLSPPCPCHSEAEEGCLLHVPLFYFLIWSPKPFYRDLTFCVLYLLINPSAIMESLWRWGRLLVCLLLYDT